MNDANAKSSVASKKEVEKGVSIKVVCGQMKVDKTLEMDPEHALDFSVEMVDLVKSVGSFTRIYDNNGNLVKRKDEKTKNEYVLDKNSVVKAIKQGLDNRTK